MILALVSLLCLFAILFIHSFFDIPILNFLEDILF